jgi:hypothetical protein
VSIGSPAGIVDASNIPDPPAKHISSPHVVVHDDMPSVILCKNFGNKFAVVPQLLHVLKDILFSSVRLIEINDLQLKSRLTGGVRSAVNQRVGGTFIKKHAHNRSSRWPSKLRI